MSPKPAAALVLLLTACSADVDQPMNATEPPPITSVGGDSSGSATTSSGEPMTTAGSTSEDPTSEAPTTEAPTTTSTSDTGTTTDTTTGAPIDCADLPLCEDFEGAALDGPPDPALWTITSPNCAGNGKLAVTAEQAHGGSQSLRVDAGGGYCDHIFITSTAIAGLGPRVFGRFHVRFQYGFAAGHTTFLAMRDAGDGSKDLRMGGQSEVLIWNRQSDDATLPSLSPAGIAKSLEPALQQWICIEFMVDRELRQLTTWVDGAEVPGLRIDAEPTPDIDQQWLEKINWKPVPEDIKFGWESYANQPMILYFDDIALSSAPLGCL